MTVLAPWLAVLGALAAAGVVVVHFIARAQPPERDLPTARFVPVTAVRAPSLERRPSDLLLLVLRALAVLLLGLGLAGPSVRPARRPLARVVLLDRSRAVRDHGEALARARATLAEGDVMVAFDSAARVVPADSPFTVPVRPPRGSLSAALVLAAREGRRLSASADSLELVVVSPLVREAWDAASARLRALWPGRVRLERVAAATPPEGGPIAVTAPPDDPVGATVALLGRRGAGAAVRLVRTAPTAADSAFAAAGGVLVDWPAEPASRFAARPAPDTAGAVVAGDIVVAAPFPRRVVMTADDATVVATWVDGEPAALERRLGEGCVREVAAPVAPAGDLALRPATQRFVQAMSAPCGGDRDFTPLPDSVLAASGPVAEAGVADALPASRPLAAVLLALAILALAAEQVLHRRPAA